MRHLALAIAKVHLSADRASLQLLRRRLVALLAASPLLRWHAQCRLQFVSDSCADRTIVGRIVQRKASELHGDVGTAANKSAHTINVLVLASHEQRTCILTVYDAEVASSVEHQPTVSFFTRQAGTHVLTGVVSDNVYSTADLHTGL
jgi:hypothetical protein